MHHVDVVVVGSGVMGAATAAALVGDRSVALLEQFEIGHDRGSSHGRSRIFRFSYPDPTYVAMAQEALELWRDVERRSGTGLVTTTGGLDRGPGISHNANALEDCGARFEMLTGREAARRFASFDLPEDEPVLFQPDAGVIAADDAMRTFVALAVAGGAELYEGARVIALEPEGDEIIVRTTQDSWRASTAVVTAGGWARVLLAPLGIELPTRETRETVAYFDTPQSLFETFVEWGTPSIYALPSPGQGIKAGEHIAGDDTDANEPGRVDAASIKRLSAWVASRFRRADARPHFAETCIYTNTPDESFILERHGPIVIGSACSGHGFKFAPLIGKRLAALAG